MRILLGALTLAIAIGCASLAPSFPVNASRGDLERLTGDWRGEYVGDRDHARHGSIAFKLVAGENHAHGTVVMTPAGFDRPYQPYQGNDLTKPPREDGLQTGVLTIRFVNASDDTVSRAIAPYWDPDRRTQASAAFRGHFSKDTIEGTFTTTYADGTPTTGGRWRVNRIPIP